MFDQKTVLACGAAGFIGSNFVHYLMDKYSDVKVINYDKLTYAGNPENLTEFGNDDRYEFVQGDIADLEHVLKVFEKYEPDYLVNFAAETHVSRSVNENAAPFMWTNILGVQTLLEAIKRKGIKKAVFFSTDEVFGTLDLDEERRFSEDDPFAPNVPYAAAKAGGDLLCRAYHQSFNVPVIVTHCCNNYGPRQHPEKLVPFFTFRALRDLSLPLHGDGKHMREWIHVEDTARAVDYIIKKGQLGEVFNIASGDDRSVREVTKRLLDIVGASEDLVEFVEDRPGNDRRYSLDNSKLRSLGWEPEHDFNQGLSATIQWYRNNKDWVDNFVKRAAEFDKHIEIYGEQGKSY